MVTSDVAGALRCYGNEGLNQIGFWWRAYWFWGFGYNNVAQLAATWKASGRGDDDVNRDREVLISGRYWWAWEQEILLFESTLSRFTSDAVEKAKIDDISATSSGEEMTVDFMNDYRGGMTGFSDAHCHLTKAITKIEVVAFTRFVVGDYAKELGQIIFSQLQWIWGWFVHWWWSVQ